MSDNGKHEFAIDKQAVCRHCSSMSIAVVNGFVKCNDCGTVGNVDWVSVKHEASELERLREENRELREDMTLLMDMVNMLLIKQDTVARDILPLEAAQQQVREVAADINQRLRLSRARARTEENGT